MEEERPSVWTEMRGWGGRRETGQYTFRKGDGWIRFQQESIFSVITHIYDKNGKFLGHLGDSIG